jgi:hypothetical protein
MSQECESGKAGDGDEWVCFIMGVGITRVPMYVCMHRAFVRRRLPIDGDSMFRRV